ncbi:MAG: hypothetical protein Q9M94_03290 [Candidatus Gracilibacteria bacterium]|nr:hypothetical protein [Candidatus Gracilibacteria bacterium]MDQ7022632.1 hypothetical protein [Candidatus Gracilibacteria bacterium]
MILQDVRNIGNYLKDKNFDKTYVMGRSLGTGPASYFAKSFKTDKLLLVSAYDELYKVAYKKYPIFPIKYLFTQNYKSISYLNNFKNNFLLIHGKIELIIIFLNLKKLKGRL